MSFNGDRESTSTKTHLEICSGLYLTRHRGGNASEKRSSSGDGGKHFHSSTLFAMPSVPYSGERKSPRSADGGNCVLKFGGAAPV